MPAMASFRQLEGHGREKVRYWRWRAILVRRTCAHGKLGGGDSGRRGQGRAGQGHGSHSFHRAG